MEDLLTQEKENIENNKLGESSFKKQAEKTLYEAKIRIPYFRNAIEKNNSEKIKDALEQIDFDVIESIFQEIYRKSGIDINNQDSIFKRRFISKNNVSTRLTGEKRKNTPSSTLAITKYRVVNRPDQEFSNIEPFVEFNPLAQVFSKQLNLADHIPSYFFVCILKVLSHEEVHATQFHGNIDMPNRNENLHVEVTGISETVSSYNEDGENININTQRTTNGLLNEGLVEIISDTVAEEYLKRIGRMDLSGRFFKAYPVGRILVELLIRKIAFETSVPKDIILNGLIRASYEGVSLMNSELYSEFGEEVRKLLENYKHLDNSNKDYTEEVLKLCREFMKTIDIGESLDPSILKFIKNKKLS